MPKRVKIGDILEIPTKKGLAYVQLSHNHEIPPLSMGELIRVLPGFFPERPAEFQSLANQKELYHTFIGAEVLVRRKIFSVVGHAEVPAAARKFPLFRAGAITPAGKVEYWWLWDGEKEWRIGKLTDEQLDLPIRAFWNDLSLIYHLEVGWTPRKDEALVQAARLKMEIKKAPVVKGVRHFLLYGTMPLARNGQELLEKGGFKSELLEANDTFMLMVEQPPPYSEEYVESTTRRLADLAEKSHGTYDCWETELG
jgi:hypothetical protein